MNRIVLLLAAAAAAVAVTAASSGGGNATISAPGGAATSAPSGSAAAKADCSMATASRLADQHRLNNFLLPNPIRQLLCGPFTGPGSEAMVFTLGAPTCWPVQGWAVFSFRDGDWRLALSQPLVFVVPPLVAVGGDLRETRPVYRQGDSRCNPSGGTHARTWHWNGSSFTAGAWKQVKPPTASPRAAKDGYFKTPSGNIVCYHSPGPADRPVGFLGCGIKTGLKPAPPRRPCENGGYAGDRVELSATGRVRVPACAGDPGPFSGLVVGARVLGYGKMWSGSGLSCRSTFSGLTCRNRSSHGFFLSRARWRRF